MRDADLEAFTGTLRGPRVVFGAGVAESELAAELDLLGLERVLLIASARERKAGDAILDPVAGRLVGHVEDVRRHVPAAAAKAAAARARELDVDGVLSIGGGSAVGTAKAVALETGLPIVAVPTTYAGSELTPIYGITDGAQKRTGRSDLVLPRTVLLDPTLSARLPPDLARVSAVNALAHCAGGFFAAGRSPVTDLLAGEGVRRLAAGLRAFTGNPADPGARATLTLGGYLAGTVLALAGSSAHHAICHVLGGAFDLPHAETHAAVLPHSVAFLQEIRPSAADLLAGALGATDPARSVADLLAEIGAVVRLREIGLAGSDLARAADRLAGRGPEPGVRGMDPARAEQLLAAAW